ncbi:MAG: hypothetical protein IKW90_15090 [Lachnospiraceae bacterium]|nr:hypothetical protein [Lachnospiraceae bacterium]
MIESNGNMYMPVAPAYGYGNGGMGNGMFGGDWAWIILLLLLGWGNNGNGFGGGGMNGLYPWMNQADSMNAGFRGVQIDSQMAAIQAAVSNGFQNLSSQFAQCCCDNKLAVADLKYTVATENCADRTQSIQNTRDIIDNQNRNNQLVLDKLCQLELDNVKTQLEQARRDNVNLQNQLNLAVTRNDLNAEVDALYNRLKNCPVGTVPVYGSQPIFTCPGNGFNGCGCAA